MNTVKNFTAINLRLNQIDVFGRCNTLNDLSNKRCVPNKTEMIEQKYVPFKSKCRFDGRKCNSDQWWDSGKGSCECINRHVCEID